MEGETYFYTFLTTVVVAETIPNKNNVNLHRSQTPKTTLQNNNLKEILKYLCKQNSNDDFIFYKTTLRN